jgi:nicotinate-nucleotide adenylyltransferase
MKIGIFGGTFNPVHTGHIRGAISVYETFGLDKVIFIPTGIPPHKKDNVAAAEYRYQMLKLAVDDIDNFDVSRIEIDSNIVNYTIDTVKTLKQTLSQDELFFMVGTDAFFYLDLWKDYRNLIELVSFILMKRPEFDTTPIVNKYKNILNFFDVDDKIKYNAKSGFVYIYAPPAFDISSSMIREKLKQGAIVRYLVPEKVEEFIQRKGLYRI